MKIKWSPEAIADLVDLREYIASDNPDAAQRIALIILDTVEFALSENPACGHPGRVHGTRELVIPKTPVIIPYRVRNSVLEILGVYHQARRWPDRF